MPLFSLPSDLEEYVIAKIQSGEYTCVSEVIVHGLYLLQDRDALRRIKRERPRKEIAVGRGAADCHNVISSEEAFFDIHSKIRRSQTEND